MVVVIGGGIVGVRDPATHELYLLFPTWGRRGVIAYFDSPPGGGTTVFGPAHGWRVGAGLAADSRRGRGNALLVTK